MDMEEKLFDSFCFLCSVYEYGLRRWLGCFPRCVRMWMSVVGSFGLYNLLSFACDVLRARKLIIRIDERMADGCLV